MKTKKLSLIFVLLLTMVCGSVAMAQNPIRWRCSARMLSEVEGELTVRAIIDKGWHLYGMQLSRQA